MNKFKTAVLIDRNHKKYPVKADFKGLSLSTSLQEHIHVVFDENEVVDMATFENPHQFSKGFKYVFVNGAMTVDKGAHNGARKGMAIRNKN